MGIVFAVAPFQMSQVAEANGAGLKLAEGVPAGAVIPGVLLGLGTVVSAALLVWGRTILGMAAMAVTMGCCIIGAWRVHLPLIAAYNQGPVIALMQEAYKEGGDLALYKNVSYAALFYGQRDIDMLKTYKFTGDDARLDTPGDAPLYVITSQEYEQELRRAHPQLVPVRAIGTLVMYRLRAAGEPAEKH
jgi:hypothetical protein